MNERIKKMRIELDLSQEKFGERLGVTKTAISAMETGRRNPSNQIIMSICREFNVSDEWLRNGDGEMFVVLSQAERAARAVASKLKTDNPFILNAFIALGEMTEAEWTVVEKFVDGLKSGDK